MMETGRICPLSAVSCGPTNSPHCPRCAEQHQGHGLAAFLFPGMKAYADGLDRSAHLAISSSELGCLGGWFSVQGRPAVVQTAESCGLVKTLPLPSWLPWKGGMLKGSWRACVPTAALWWGNSDYGGSAFVLSFTLTT